MSKISGVYSIFSKISNKYYIGESHDCLDRLKRHKNRLLNNNHVNSHLQEAFNKYGEDNFEFEIIIQCSKDYRKSEENYWCNLLDTHNRKFGYNILPTSPGYGITSHSEETKKKMRKPRNYKHKKESIDKMILKLKGRKIPKERIDRAVKTRKDKGYKHSENTKENMRHPRYVPFDRTEKRKNYWLSISKKVLQYDKNMNLLNEFESPTVAEEKTGVNAHSIRANCNFNGKENIKKYRKIKSFIWKYK